MVLKKASRRGGMADASDSKSDEGNFVWVQVPSPAYKKLATLLQVFLLYRKVF